MIVCLTVFTEEVSKWTDVLDAAWTSRRKSRKKDEDMKDTKTTDEKWHSSLSGQKKFDILIRLWMRTKEQVVRRNRITTTQGEAAVTGKRCEKAVRKPPSADSIPSSSTAKQSKDEAPIYSSSTLTASNISVLADDLALAHDLGDAYRTFIEHSTTNK